jgi:hypothetical protein
VAQKKKKKKKKIKGLPEKGSMPSDSFLARGRNGRTGDRRGIALGGRLRKARLLGGVALDAAVARRRQLQALVVAANLGAHAVKMALGALSAQCSSGVEVDGESRGGEQSGDSDEQEGEAH